MEGMFVVLVFQLLGYSLTFSELYSCFLGFQYFPLLGVFFIALYTNLQTVQIHPSSLWFCWA